MPSISVTRVLNAMFLFFPLERAVQLIASAAVHNRDCQIQVSVIDLPYQTWRRCIHTQPTLSVARYCTTRIFTLCRHAAAGVFAVRAISPFAIPAALLLPSPGKKGRRDHPRTAIGGALFHPFRIDKDRAS
jgi:hypothetical protein